jgi:short-subunit dehydrogenase
MAKADRKFWVASPEKAAAQIFDAIRKGKKHVYVTRRWRLIAWLFKGMPDWIVGRIG